MYGKIKDATGLSVRHISRIINHTKAVDLRDLPDIGITYLR